MKLSAALIRYLETLRISQGRLAGQPFAVWPWESRFIRGSFAEGVQSAALSVARGNGKTALLAGIGAACLDGPIAVARGEALLCASSYEQARIGFEHVISFLESRGHDLKDRKKWRVWDTAQIARIEHRASGARVRCLGSDPRRAHGLAPILVLADEPAQWPLSTGEKMLAALRTAAGKQPFSRFIALGTRPENSDHWFAKMLAGGCDYFQLHAARSGDPPFQQRIWRLANPSLGYLPDLAAALQAESKLAKRDSALLASFEALRLNLGVADTESQGLLDAALWRQIEGNCEPLGRSIWGIDLGTSEAQSAIACYWPDNGALQCLAALPSEPNLAERGRRDGVDRLYLECHKRGELLTLGHRSVDISALLQAALERFGRPAMVVSDRWRAPELRDALDRAGIPAAALEARGMGYRDGAADVRLFRRAVAEGRVIPAVSLLLRAAMLEAKTISDPAGNAKLAKGSQGGRRQRAKDDAAAAAILAVAAGQRLQTGRPQRRLIYRGAA